MGPASTRTSLILEFAEGGKHLEDVDDVAVSRSADFGLRRHECRRDLARAGATDERRPAAPASSRSPACADRAVQHDPSGAHRRVFRYRGR